MGSINFKNKLVLRDKSYGLERRQNLTKEELSNSSPLPNPVTYEDIDEAFKKWVEDELDISYEGKKLPTYTLFSNQRFSEYLQMWEHVDEKKNPVLNFKTVTRESNPQTGTINDVTKNIPGEQTFLMKRVEARDKNDRKYYIDYRMKQPLGVDFRYIVSVMTNKYELLNQFNQAIQEKFKAITAYFRPKGHFMSMNLESVSDESVYNIDDRQFYSQSASILVKAYIIPEDYFVVEEKPAMRILGFDMEERKETYADIEEGAIVCPENDFYYKPITVTMSFAPCDDKIKFVIDTNFTIKEIEYENVFSFVFKVNDEIINIKEIISRGETFTVKENDEIKIKKLGKKNSVKTAMIILKGYNKDVVYDIKKNDGYNQTGEDIIVENI